MKKIYLAGLAVLIVAAILLGASDAGAQSRLTLKNQATYTNSQIDTIFVTAQKWTAGSNIWLRASYGDTVSAIYSFAGRIEGETSWSAIAVAAGDTVTYANTGSINKGIVLRSPTVDRYAGLDVDIRIIVTYAGSANGTTSDNLYDLFWWIRN
jgi:hypothetical protein